MDFLEKLYNSQPSLDQANSFVLFSSLFSKGHPDWILVSSEIVGIDRAVRLAENFTTTYAQVNSTTQTYVTSSPAHIFQGASPDASVRVVGVLYSNGAVAHVSSVDPTNSPVLFVWLDKTVADAYGLGYVDPHTQTVHNVSVEEAFTLFTEDFHE